MKRKMIWLGGVILIVGAAAVYLHRGAGAGSLQTGLQPGPVESHPALAHAGPTPGADAEAMPRSQETQTGPRANGSAKQPGTTATRKPAPKDPRIASQERAFMARLFSPPGPSATEQERLFWEQSPISDLLYPQGHPCAGQPLDSTSSAVLAGAGQAALKEMIDSIPDVDEPECLYQGNWPFHPLNQACSAVNKQNAESVQGCAQYLLAAPQDPKAYPATIWLPCSGGAQATTKREYFNGLLDEQVQQVFSGPPCTAP